MKQWQGISEFVAVAEQGSFTQAATVLGLSVAQVSRNVSELEQRLGVKLLHRSTRRVSLSAEGQTYLQHCRHIVRSLEEANLAMSDLQAKPQGLLKVTAPVFYGERLLAPLLNRFLQQHPEIQLELILTNQRLDLIAGRFDLAIRLGHLQDSSLLAQRLGQRAHYVVASPAYIKAHGAPVQLADLEAHELLAGTLDYWSFNLGGRQQRVRPGKRLHCNSGLALLDAAERGLGLAQLPDYYVKDSLAAGRLQALLPQLQPKADGIWALYPQNRLMSAKVRSVVEYLKAELTPAAEANKY